MLERILCHQIEFLFSLLQYKSIKPNECQNLENVDIHSSFNISDKRLEGKNVRVEFFISLKINSSIGEIILPIIFS